MLDLIQKDWKSHSLREVDPSLRDLIIAIVGSYKFRILVKLRIAHYLINGGFLSRRLAGYLVKRNARYGCEISPYAQIGGGLRLAHPCGIIVGDAVIIGENVRVLQGVTLGGSGGKVRKNDADFTMPRLDDNVVVGPGAKVLGPVVLGKCCIIGANAVVTQDVECLNVVAGVPAKVIKVLTAEDVYPAHYPEMLDLIVFLQANEKNT